MLSNPKRHPQIGNMYSDLTTSIARAADVKSTFVEESLCSVQCSGVAAGQAKFGRSRSGCYWPCCLICCRCYRFSSIYILLLPHSACHFTDPWHHAVVATTDSTADYTAGIPLSSPRMPFTTIAPSFASLVEVL